jgi:hypothetical protein
LCRCTGQGRFRNIIWAKWLSSHLLIRSEQSVKRKYTLFALSGRAKKRLTTVRKPVNCPCTFVNPASQIHPGSYHAMVKFADDAVGNVTAALKRKAGMWEQTLIVFSGDNGGWMSANGTAGGNNYPLAGGKYSTCAAMPLAAALSLRLYLVLSWSMTDQATNAIFLVTRQLGGWDPHEQLCSGRVHPGTAARHGLPWPRGSLGLVSKSCPQMRKRCSACEEHLTNIPPHTLDLDSWFELARTPTVRSPGTQRLRSWLASIIRTIGRLLLASHRSILYQWSP